jgi:hypothetical protein
MIENREMLTVVEKFNVFLNEADLAKVFSPFLLGVGVVDGFKNILNNVDMGGSSLLYVPYVLSSNRDIVFDINSDTGEMYQIVSIFTSFSYGVGDVLKNLGKSLEAEAAYVDAHNFSDQMNFNHVMNVFPNVVSRFKNSTGVSSEEFVEFFVHYVETLQLLKENFAESIESMVVSWELFKRGFSAVEVANIFQSSMYDVSTRKLVVNVDMLKPYVGVPLSWVEKIVS